MSDRYAAEVKRLCPQLTRDYTNRNQRVLSKRHEGECTGMKIGIVVNRVGDTEKTLKFIATCLLTTIDRLCMVWLPDGTSDMLRATTDR